MSELFEFSDLTPNTFAPKADVLIQTVDMAPDGAYWTQRVELELTDEGFKICNSENFCKLEVFLAKDDGFSHIFGDVEEIRRQFQEMFARSPGATSMLVHFSPGRKVHSFSLA